jgi:Zinc carboxypeptidase
MRRLAAGLAGSVLTALLPAQTPATTPERTQHAETSRAADVQTFVDACVRLSHGDRLAVRIAGKSHEGRAQLLVRIADPAPAAAPRLRALVIGNIHAGEVEGKEALQVLVREFASGQHGELLQHCELWFLPIYNIDGNEQVGTKNRAGQNGPAAAGQRANAQGLDLNRDFVKADAPETRTLLGLFRELDPHLFVDLHTTNGSYHGYHLTFAPSLNPNVDPELMRLHRTLLDGAQAAMQAQHGFATFDYGNFETRDWEGNGAPESGAGVRGWYSYDARARYGVNYFGLRNRLAVLSEAYSYADFATRIAATRAFVLVLLQQLVERRTAVLATCAAADERLRQRRPAWFGFDTTFGAGEPLPVLVGEVDTIAASGEQPVRHVRKGSGQPETMPVHRSFRARQQRALPAAWAILSPSPEVVQRLQWHGIEFEAVRAVRTVTAERFAVDKKRKPKRPYQGHQELALDGAWAAPAAVELPLGTLLVPAEQRLARLAAVLLEPQSEDSLSTWNFFEAATDTHYPVLRVLAR